MKLVVILLGRIFEVGRRHLALSSLIEQWFTTHTKRNSEEGVSFMIEDLQMLIHQLKNKQKNTLTAIDKLLLLL